MPMVVGSPRSTGRWATSRSATSICLGTSHPYEGVICDWMVRVWPTPLAQGLLPLLAMRSTPVLKPDFEQLDLTGVEMRSGPGCRGLLVLHASMTQTSMLVNSDLLVGLLCQAAAEGPGLADGWTSQNVLTLVISVVAAFLSMLALGWQIYSWLHSGPRVKVTAQHGFALGGSDLEFVSITATNSGRLQTVIHEFGFEVPGRRRFVEFQSFVPIKLPADLPPGGSVSFYFERQRLRRSAEDEGVHPTQLRSFARGGHGVTYGNRLRFL